MKKILFTNISKYLFIFLILFSFFTNIALAIDTTVDTSVGGIEKGFNGASNNLKTVAEDPSVGYKETSIEELIGKIIKSILAVLGILFLIFIIISGLQWMTAGGNEEVIDKSKKRIKNATYGLAIILAAYAITMFITSWLVDKTGFNQNL